MQIHRGYLVGLAAALLLVVGGAPRAWADFTDVAVFAEDDGFTGVCTAPCFNVEKFFQFFDAGSANDPGYCSAGEDTYVYTLTHLGGSLPPPNIPVTEFEGAVDDALVANAGWDATVPFPGDVDPLSVTVSTLDLVNWGFPSSTSCPNCLDQGQTSAPLWLCCDAATTDPVMKPGNFSVTALILDAPGENYICGAGECELDIDKTCCVPSPPSPGVDQCDGKVLRMVFEYTGDDCTATTNDQEGKAKCSGDTQFTAPMDVVVTKDENKIAIDGNIGGSLPTTYILDDTFTVTNEEDAPNVKELKASTKLRLDAPGGSQELTIHTSCSKALSCGDEFGALKLVLLETTEGGVIDCSTPEVPGTACVPETAPPFACEDKIVSILFRWTGEACQNPLPNPQDGKAECAGTQVNAEPVNVTYTGKDANKITVSPASNIDIDDTFSLTATGTNELKASTKLLITDAVGVVQNLEIHTSCSKPIDCGDVFGGLEIVQILGKDGSVCDLTPPGPLFQDACEVPLAPPTPHCTSKLMELQLAYIADELGEGCNVSNPQDGKASCTGVDDLGDDVDITITKDPDKISADPDTDIDAPFGTTVEIISFTNEENAPDVKELPSTLEFTATGTGGSQDIEIHTSCSQPLNLGDRFGNFAVVGMDRKDEGFIGLGGEVEFQYTVTSLAPPNTVDVTNLMVTDDMYGTIVTGETLTPGETKTFFATRTLIGTTTNIATVTGDHGTSECPAVQDDLTTTVTQPPQGFFDCSDAKPIDELSMEWADDTRDVCVVAWDGDAGSGFLAQEDDVTLDDVVTVSGMGGSPNDQEWEIFAAGDCGGTLLGTSKFHISCSDSDMNGVEDCGKNQGNGKDDDLALINDWLLEGMKGDLELDCTPDPIVLPPGGGGGCGLSVELLVLLPGFAWLYRRRRLS